MTAARLSSDLARGLGDELRRRGAKRIAVAMSGGVDSTIAALLLKEAGADLFGVTMAIDAAPEALALAATPRVAVDVAHIAADAARAAAELGIPHHVVDLGQEFAAAVVQPYIEAYARGATPNPCVVCNRDIKFGLLLARARDLGATHLATGHYARVAAAASGRHLLYRGRDRQKDQSYVLHWLRQDQLAAAVFPVAKLNKEDVRALARRLGLAAHDRPESQEACFVSGDYRDFLRRAVPEALRPGPILDAGGAVLGEHGGLGLYTVGQRQGLGLGGRRAPGGGPLYVVALDPARNAVVVGGRWDLRATGLVARDLNFIPFDRPPGPLQVATCVRYRGREVASRVEFDGAAARVTFAAPLEAVTPGQSAVFYDGDAVVGGGLIVSALR